MEPIPTDAMIPCGKNLSELPDNFHDLPVRDAVEILSVNHVVDSTRFFQCSRKQTELTGWIERSQ